MMRVQVPGYAMHRAQTRARGRSRAVRRTIQLLEDIAVFVLVRLFYFAAAAVAFVFLSLQPYGGSPSQEVGEFLFSPLYWTLCLVIAAAVALLGPLAYETARDRGRGSLQEIRRKSGAWQWD